jgi:hypothetical protein
MPPRKPKAPVPTTAVVPYVEPGPDVTPPVTDSATDHDPPDDPTIEKQLAIAEQWQTAWELHMSGVSYRKIGQQLGVSGQSVMRYVRRHQRKLGHSPRWEDERERQLAVLAELEHKLWREAAGKDGTSWVAVSNQIRAVHADMRALMGYGNIPAAGNGTGAIGQPDAGQPAEVPTAVAQVLTRLRVVA